MIVTFATPGFVIRRALSSPERSFKIVPLFLYLNITSKVIVKCSLSSVEMPEMIAMLFLPTLLPPGKLIRDLDDPFETKSIPSEQDKDIVSHATIILC